MIANVVPPCFICGDDCDAFDGVLASMYGGYGVNVFGIISISGFKIPNTELADRLIDWHTDIVWPMLLIFVAAHIIGALYHQFILKDHILSRMR